MLRIMMRLLLDLLLQSSDDNFPQFFSALDILLANARFVALLFKVCQLTDVVI